MAMTLGRPRKGAIAEINVTPMADVMIVLLIIFMVATPLIARAPVRLPQAVHPAEHEGERIEVLVRSDGAVLVDGQAVPPASVGEWIAALSPARRATVLVQADRQVPYSDVSHVLSACRAAGVTEVALAAQRRLGR
jgi:biopolymer transport protein TolR